MNAWLLSAAALAFAYGAARIATAALPAETRAVRATFAVAIGGAAAVTILVLLAAYRGLFAGSLFAGAALFAAGAQAFARSRGARPAPAEPLRPAAWQLPMLVPLLAALPHLLRAMASPSRAWDALTYHLPRAAQWVQDGGFVVRVAPDANRYYEFFSPGGDLLFAAAMLAGHGDAPLFLLLAGIWVATLAAAFALAQALGARPLDAPLAAAVVMTLPCVVQLAGSAYVDGLTLLFTLAVRAAEAPRGSAALAVGALLAAGACALNKTSAIPLLLLVAAHGAWLARRGRIRPVVYGGGLAIAALPIALWMSHAAFHTGSPTYPIGLTVAGHELTSGNELFRITHHALTPFMASEQRGLAEFFRSLFVGTVLPDWPHLNLGLGGAVAIALGPIALLSMKRRSPVERGLLLLVALLPLALVLLPSAAALRGMWWGAVSGRLLTPLVAVPACLAAAGDSKLFRYGLGLALALSLPSLVPAGLALEDLSRGAVPIAIGGALSLALVALALAPLRAPVRLGAFAAVAVIAPLAIGGLAGARASVRDAYYASEGYEFHPAPFRSHAPVWARLDGDGEERIALSVGFVEPGHNWFRYPLYGSRHQNRVLYVPATRSGQVYDTWDPATAGADMDADAYVARLRRLGITAVVLVAPPAPEARFVMNDPRRFALEYQTPEQDVLLYRLRPEGP